MSAGVGQTAVRRGTMVAQRGAMAARRGTTVAQQGTVAALPRSGQGKAATTVAAMVYAAALA